MEGELKRLVLVLVSGGVDSLLLADMAQRCGHEVHLMQIMYMHPAMPQEHDAVDSYCRSVGGDVHMNLFRLDLNLSGWKWMGTGPYTPGARVVPMRNAYMVIAAAHRAAGLKTKLKKEVWIGATAEDGFDYADCRSEYISLLSDICFPFGVEVRAPLVEEGLTKKEIKYLAKSRGLLEHSWSCYEPVDNRPCGECNSCVQYEV